MAECAVCCKLAMIQISATLAKPVSRGSVFWVLHLMDVNTVICDHKCILGCNDLKYAVVISVVEMPPGIWRDTGKQIGKVCSVFINGALMNQ